MKIAKQCVISIMSCIMGGVCGVAIAHFIGCHQQEIKAAISKFLPVTMGREELVRQIEIMTWQIEEKDHEILVLRHHLEKGTNTVEEFKKSLK